MILVTGGSGLLGGELINQLLAKGEHVKAIYNQHTIEGISNSNFQQVQCDILDVIGLEEQMENVNYVYHCAGLVSFTRKNSEKLFKVNVEGTANVADAALNAGVKKLLHVSSVAAIGHGDKNTPVTEKTVWINPTSRYGHSKYLGELEVWRAIAEGLPAVIVNPSIILGSGNWNTGSTEIFKSVYNEFPWYTDGVAGFVDVKDVAKAMIMLMESDISGERFIINAENTSYRNVFAMMSKAFNKKPATKKVTPFLASVVWRLQALKSLFTGKAPLVTKETATTALSVVHYENKKLFEFLPQFQYQLLSDTIDEYCKLLQQKLNNR